MNLNQQLSTLDRQTTLSTLWIFVLLNVIFRDIHEFFRPGFLPELMTGTMNGTQMSQEFLLVAGILLELSIVMVVLSRILSVKLNRWANMVVSVIAILAMGMNTTNPDLDDLFFAAVQIIGLITILWLAWKWPQEQPVHTH